jgi:tetratricopeptide (TPR) repeat protein
MPVKLALSNEVRASLEAVRVAKEAARVRARQQTLRARLWFVAAVAGLAGIGFAVAPRVGRWRQARAHTAAPAAAARPAPITVERAAPPPRPEPPSAAAPAPAPAFAPAPAPIAALPAATATPARALPAVAAGTKAPDVAARDDETCDMALVRGARWRVSPEACARAFEADPRDANLALAIAHAHHVRGNAAETLQWAQRALAIDAGVAEAYVLIGRVEAAAGRDDDARAAYRRYLELAPRGWHKAEARAAAKHDPAAAPADPSGNR